MNSLLAVGDQSVLGDLKQLASAVSGTVPVSVAYQTDVTAKVLSPENGVVKGFVHHVTPLRPDDGGLFIIDMPGVVISVDSEPYFEAEALAATIYLDLDTKADRSQDMPPSTNDLNFYEDIREGWGNRAFNESNEYIYTCYVNSEGFVTLRWMFWPGVYKWLSYLTVRQLGGRAYQKDGFKAVFSDRHTL